MNISSALWRDERWRCPQSVRSHLGCGQCGIAVIVRCVALDCSNVQIHPHSFKYSILSQLTIQIAVFEKKENE